MLELSLAQGDTLRVLAISSVTSRRETGLEPVWGCGDQGGSLRGEVWKGLEEGEAECDEERGVGKGVGKGLLFPGT